MAIAVMQQRNIPTVPSTRLLLPGFSIALDFDRAVYDCLYVALAVRTKNELITADERLANAMAARFPVKWLGAF
ncbi:MAG TPA: type II toxin-antitoxin system VapC family toxin [Candidatus Sulfotelmatobacter sp.]|nr:type II toxin-antitoxin system VapC family toxin [Candidatus Sulfotelmatobacter sp.]